MLLDFILFLGNIKKKFWQIRFAVIFIRVFPVTYEPAIYVTDTKLSLVSVCF